MGKRNLLWLTVSLISMLAITLVSACSATTPTSSQTGVVEVRAMDAPPTGVSSIVVTTRNIQIHKSDAPDDSWITVVSQEKTFDLVAIQGAEVFLGSEDVSSGNYTQIRLDVTKVIVTLDGKEITAKLPSDKLRVVRPWEVKAGQKTILTLDFQADTFVVITGNGAFDVKPVIKLDISQGERPLKTKPTPTSTPTPSQTGVVEVRAMDAPPTGVSSIMVTTSNIQIHKADTPDDSWITVVSQEKTFDLVTIQGAEVFLGSENVSSGNYTQIRLDVTKVIVTLDGKEITAKLPSDKLKVVGPWEVKAGQKTILTLDFQADTFVVITGNDQAQVKPVIKLDVSHGERPLKTK